MFTRGFFIFITLIFSIFAHSSQEIHIIDMESCDDFCIDADIIETDSCFYILSDSSNVVLSDSIIFDSLEYSMPEKIEWYDSKLFRYTHIGGSLLVLGIIEKQFDKKTRQLRNDFLPSFKDGTDNYLQVAPVFVLYGMKAAGVKSRSNLGRMVVSQAATVAFMFPLTRGMKSVFKVMRPDSSRKNSFPSGHTTTAFMTATMLHKEYGYISPWITVGSYTCAATTGLMRMANNRHWYSDVLCGAGIGMLTTEFGYWIGDLLFKEKGLNVPEHRHNHFSKYDNPSFVSFYTGINIPINKHYFSSSGESYSATAGQSFGLEGAYYINPYIGVGAKVGVTNIDYENDYTQRSPNQNIRYGQLLTGVYGNLPLTDRLSLNTKLLIGNTRFKKVETEDFVVDAYSGACANTEAGFTYKLDTHFGTRFSLNYNIINPKNKTSQTVFHCLSIGGNLIYHF